jgi:hypothetical protein
MTEKDYFAPFEDDGNLDIKKVDCNFIKKNIQFGD